MQKTTEGRKLQISGAANAAIGALAGLLLTVVLLYLFAVLISRGSINEGLSEYVILFSALCGATLAGLIAASRHGRNYIPLGLASGLSYLLMYVMLGAVCGQGILSGGLILKLLVCAVAGGATGSALKLTPKRRRKVRR